MRRLMAGENGAHSKVLCNRKDNLWKEMLWEIDFSSSCSLICQVFLSPRPPLVRQSLLTHSYFTFRNEFKSCEGRTWKSVPSPWMCCEIPKGFVYKCLFLDPTYRDPIKVQWLGTRKWALPTPWVPDRRPATTTCVNLREKVKIQCRDHHILTHKANLFWPIFWPWLHWILVLTLKIAFIQCVFAPKLRTWQNI